MTDNLIPFDPTIFRQHFPEFNKPACFPDSLLETWFEDATDIISANDSACFNLSGRRRARAIYLLTAHMGKLMTQAAGGDNPAILVSAQIDKIRIETKPPPATTQFQWWLNTTPYGAQLAVLLSVAGAGGFYVGGLPERDAFRRVGGGFGGVPPRRGC